MGSRRILAALLIAHAGSAVLAPSVQAAPVSVRFSEGVTRGLLLVRGNGGEIIAHGDLAQVARGHRVENQLTFRFKDGSVHDERVVFSQDGVFTLLSYRLTQRGPAFPQAMDVALDRSGDYTVRSRSRANGSEKESRGRLQLPADVYNGLVVTILKNVQPGAVHSVHLVAFTPAPRLIEVQVQPGGEQSVRVGELERPATRFALKPRLGPFLRFFATLLGRAPADQECLFLTDGVPAFIRCETSLYTGGPRWRVELTSPR
jgi:hypothetical protein